MTQWFFRNGELARDGWQSVVDASLEGWRHTGLRIAQLADGDSAPLESGDIERLVIPLAGSFHVEYTTGTRTDAVETNAVKLGGRRSVFDGPPDVLYLPVGASATVTGTGRVAVAEAPVSEKLAAEPHPVTYISKADVPVELRGAGRSSRQVHNYGTPAALAASKFIVCEVITPAENWSSFPAHKHDTNVPGTESRLEEIYYFETAVSRGLAAPPEADPFGLFATYSSNAGDIDINAIVRTGDIALVPYGYHGPAAAAPGYDMYYLNVMAGPDTERVWNITDDPAHGWVRSSWEGQEFDSRLPYRESEGQ
ncbi:5-deoxy-glucuronate isomerase [Paramicrobacterium chengjingii]|uniref:5-deoxy-glucuronate isomerase n=1 Tax=Paramicrobacterium chengjingii TaxID=2769067 RepID=A0ABX6YIA6_9MICO|nr:5-deoxy-glucuronate isomerase [Microbacterium chengjingii]QPZ38508.1 5-deoxy-glucuronate isomerase [Microbacterium chengjingii]